MTGRARVNRVRIYKCAACKRVITVYIPGVGWVGSAYHEHYRDTR